MPSPKRPQVATQLLTPHAWLPPTGEWNLLPLLGAQPPDFLGLSTFLHGNDRAAAAGAVWPGDHLVSRISLR